MKNITLEFGYSMVVYLSYKYVKMETNVDNEYQNI